MKTRKRLLSIVLTLALGLGVWTLAYTFSPTNANFAAGDTLSAAELNTLLNYNFDAVGSALNQLDSEKLSVDGGSMNGSLGINVNSGDPALALKNEGAGAVLSAMGASGFGTAIVNDGDLILGPMSTEGAETIRIDAETGTIENKVGSGLPLAFGSVTSVGDISSGTSNWSVSQNGMDYEITITGENYFFPDYSTIVTPNSGNVISARTDSSGGTMIVELYDNNGNQVTGSFHFVTFAAPPLP